MNWHLISNETALQELESNQEHGLTQSEAVLRLAKHGHNELVEKGGRTPLKILWEQFTATMVLILIAATVDCDWCWRLGFGGDGSGERVKEKVVMGNRNRKAERRSRLVGEAARW